MKAKILVGIFIVISVATIVWAFAYPAIITQLNTSTFVAVRLPADHSCSAYALWTEDENDWVKSSSSDGSDPITVTQAMSFNISLGKSSAGTIICYAKGTTVTKLVGEILKR